MRASHIIPDVAHGFDVLRPDDDHDFLLGAFESSLNLVEQDHDSKIVTIRHRMVNCSPSAPLI